MEKSGESSNLFSTIYSIIITPEEESVFIKKLPAGDYLISKIHMLGLFDFYVNLGAKLTVAPGQATYVGKLVANIPHRSKLGSKYLISIQDDQEKTLSSLNKEYQAIISPVTKNLMVLK